MAKQLAANVYVDGELHEAGSTPPKEIADRITNPRAWGEDADDDAEEAPAPAKKTTSRRSSGS